MSKRDYAVDPIRFGSLCSGIEAASVAWSSPFSPLNWQAQFFSEIDPFCCKLLKHYYPGVFNAGDLNRIRHRAPILRFLRSRDIDVLACGSPCFPAGTLILTYHKGLIPIEEVRVGDKVFTHENRWQKVEVTGSKEATTWELKGQGHFGFRTTADHPFLSLCVRRSWNNDRRSYDREHTGKEWTKAGAMKGKFWASPTFFPDHKPPEIRSDRSKGENEVPELSVALFTLIGRWLGDGWIRRWKNRAKMAAMICCGKTELSELRNIIVESGLSASFNEERTSFRFAITSTALVRWLLLHFGEYAHKKTLPSWVYGMPENFRRALFDGYLGADGGQNKAGSGTGLYCVTVSKQLAIGIGMLARTLGYSVSIFRNETSPTKEIEGRVIRQRPWYRVQFSDCSRSSFKADGFSWGLVRKIQDERTEIVYNLQVARDCSYIADGMVVHNCQSFSVAGKRAGIRDPRGNLSLEFAYLASVLRPRWIVWENVPGVLTSWSGISPDSRHAKGPVEGWEQSDFDYFLSTLEDCGYGLAYRVLDAKYSGLAQRRERVLLVGYLGDWRPATAVLFDEESVSGSVAPSREKGEGITHEIASSLTKSGRGVERVGDTRGQDNLVAATLDASFSRLQGQSGQDLNHGHSHLIAYGGNNTSGPISVATACNAKGGTGRSDFESETLICFSGKDYGADAQFELAPTLRAMEFAKSHANAGGQLSVVIPDTSTSFLPQGYRIQDTGSACESVSCNPAGGMRVSPVHSRSGVRRLTPRECERLMGFPDDYTLIPTHLSPQRERGSSALSLYRYLCQTERAHSIVRIRSGRVWTTPDGPRYKALGNSWAIPDIRWIGSRIQWIDGML